MFIRRRTADEIAKENAVDVGGWGDAQTDAERTQKPEWLVVVGVCTHLDAYQLPMLAITTVGFARATGVTTTRAGGSVKDRRRRI